MVRQVAESSRQVFGDAVGDDDELRLLSLFAVSEEVLERFMMSLGDPACERLTVWVYHRFSKCARRAMNASCR